MKMYTRPVDQGQIVEVSYGYDESGYAYRRTHDRSDGSIAWERGQIDWDREPEETSNDHVPCVVAWNPCSGNAVEDCDALYDDA